MNFCPVSTKKLRIEFAKLDIGRSVIVAIVIAVIFSFISCTSVSSQEEPNLNFKDYNLVFISFDALQAAHTHCLGYSRNTTPLIDEFAARGFLFTEAIAQASWTVPSSMCWFTSLYPSEHKVVNKYSVYTDKDKILSNLSQLSPAVVTLPEILKENGYATAGFTGDAGVSAKFGFGKGFDFYIDDIKFGGFDHSLPLAMQWLRDHKDKKFFIFLHGYDCHGQYDPPGSYKRSFLDFNYRGTLKGGKEEQGRLREEGLERGKIKLLRGDVRFWRALYDEKIYDADQRVKSFIEELEKLRLAGKTIVIMTSDHGTEFYEHKRFDHGFSLYDELIHVPLVMYLPGMRGGKKINDQVRAIDIMPTILEVLNIESTDTIKKQMRGTSLVPFLKGQHIELDAFSETDYRLFTHKRSIRTPDGWKFIYTLETDEKELYNLRTDPHELRNLITTNKRKAYELEQKLFKWLSSMQTNINAYRNAQELKIKEY